MSRDQRQGATKKLYERNRKWAGRLRRKWHRPVVVERLEGRRLLSIVHDAKSGEVVVQGGPGQDTVEVTLMEGSTLRVSLATGDTRQAMELPQGKVTAVRFHAGAGNDVFRNRTSVPSRVYGDEGSDIIEGGAGDDELHGGSGNDFIRGGAGNDRLFGGGGTDYLYGQEGDDILEGGNDRDFLWGDSGIDVLKGGPGADFIWGGEGNDRAWGGSGDDWIDGGPGDDRLQGELGDDILRGGEGNDGLLGNQGNDILLGGPGKDLLMGGSERDLLIGGADEDSLHGEQGEDVLLGGHSIYDDNSTLLRALRDLWVSEEPYQARVAALQTARVFLKVNHTALDDAVSDRLFGGADRDWFFETGIIGGHHHDDQGHGGHDHEHGEHTNFRQQLLLLDKLVDWQVGETVSTGIPHFGNAVLREEHLALFDLVAYQKVSHRAVNSGNWSDTSTWQDGAVPDEGARVLVPAGITLTVDGKLDAMLRSVRVDGVLHFASDRDTLLRVDTLVVDVGGELRMGTAEEPIPPEFTARIEIAGEGPIDRVEDPMALGRGLIVHGAATLHGAEKSPFTTLSTGVASRATSIILDEVPLGWRPGDRLVIAGTARGEDEIAPILSIDGKVVTLARPLRYAHASPRSELKLHVANLDRNVVVASAQRALDMRGHVMFMHTRKVEIANAGFYQLGRSNKRLPVNDSVVDRDNVLREGTGTNPRGRYAVHFHRAGVQGDALPARVTGSVVLDSPGWGFVNHSSNVDFTANVAYDVRGAAFVTEVGDEIGRFDGNLAIRAFGSGSGIESRNALQDFGHQGDGFWFQGGGVKVTNNVATGVTGHGFVFFTRALEQRGLPTARFLADNLPDPRIAKGAATIDVGEVPIHSFSNNTVYSSNIGVATRFHQLSATHNQQSVLEGIVAWNNSLGMDVPYTNNTVIRNVILWGSLVTPRGVGIERNDVTRNITYENVSIRGFEDGIRIPFRGQNLIVGGIFQNVRDVVVETALESGRRLLITGGPQFLRLSGRALAGREKLFVAMVENFYPHGQSIFHVFGRDQVILDFGPWNGRRLYFAAQHADYVPFPRPSAYVPQRFVGLTNRELRDQFRVSVGGALIPEGSEIVPFFRGYVGPAT